jgi:hypothetical protein
LIGQVPDEGRVGKLADWLEREGGDGEVDRGATFYFALPPLT